MTNELSCPIHIVTNDYYYYNFDSCLNCFNWEYKADADVVQESHIAQPRRKTNVSVISVICFSFLFLSFSLCFVLFYPLKNNPRRKINKMIFAHLISSYISSLFACHE